MSANANSVPGGYSVSASANGVGINANFILNNLCAQDSDCGTGAWCNAGSCAPQLVNSTLIPSVTGHSPTLNGNCTTAAAAVVCFSGVCDTVDNSCGYLSGDGSCTPSDAAIVCRDLACSSSGVCRTPGSCLADGDCSTPQWCDIATQTCTAPLTNGAALPIDANHTNPILDGNCTSAAAALVCVALVCDTDNACGYTNGGGNCTNSNANVVCRSGACGSDGHCGLAYGDPGCGNGNSALCRSNSCSVSGSCIDSGTCAVDGDCNAGNWCNMAQQNCTIELANGFPLPTDPNHTSITLDGNCNVAAASLVCVSGVCDSADNSCGYVNGDGNCTTANANIVCRSAVCGSDGACGLANSSGSCTVSNANSICRTGVCDASDSLCGYANGDGSCTANDANSVCRSGACGSDGSCGLLDNQTGCGNGNSNFCRSSSCSVSGACMEPNACLVDNDCTGGDWCDMAEQNCTVQLANGQSMPVDAGHTTPILDGNCTSAAANLVCIGGVCDSDGACGYANNSGTCTAGNANVVCRSTVCGSDGVCGLRDGEAGCDSSNANTLCRSRACSSDGACMPLGGCEVDADCAPNWCNISLAICVPLTANGGAMPVDANHTTVTLDGNCSTGAAILVCVSGVCDAGDSRCGYLNGDGNCTSGDANTVCRSDVCDTDNSCGYANGNGPCSQGNTQVCRSGACSVHGGVCQPQSGCAVDTDCGPSQWCDPNAFTCVALLSNGAPLPNVAGHSPVLDGNCSGAVATAVCASGVCDADNACGYADDHGTCSDSNATVCRSSTCSSTGVCRGSTECLADADCDTSLHYCDTGTSLCASKKSNSSRLPVVLGHSPSLDGNCSSAAAAVVCVSGVCSADNICGYSNGDPNGTCGSANAGTVCRSSTCSPHFAICTPPSGCAGDSDCLDTQWCNPTSLMCADKLLNDQPLPDIAGHAPILDGNCNEPVAQAVCSSGVCDPNDNRCGLGSGDGLCTASNGNILCRSGVCSSADLCMDPNACLADADCNLADQFCNTATQICTARLANGAGLPTVAGHSPTLDGTCSTDVGTAVCQSGVCSTVDRACGYPLGGPCTAGSLPEVCRSNMCAALGELAGTCVSCLTDTSCSGALTVCDPTSYRCVQCIPGDSGACTGATPICDPNAQTCVPCGGDYATVTDACPAVLPWCVAQGTAAGSCGKCSSDADCSGHPGGATCDRGSGACTAGCSSDADCPATDWCNAAGQPSLCLPKVANGDALPSTPASISTCTAAVGARVCSSGVCDSADNLCGYSNSSGPCSTSVVCRSAVCGADGTCGIPDYSEPCSASSQCRSSLCDSSQVCVAPCVADSQCAADQYCDSNSAACTATLANGSSCSRAAECVAAVCSDGVCGTGGFANYVPGGNGAARGCAAAPGYALTLLAVLALLGRGRFSRHQAP